MEQLARPTPSAITSYIATHASPATTAAATLPLTSSSVSGGLDTPPSPTAVDEYDDAASLDLAELQQPDSHAPHHLHLAHLVLHNLRHQHDWTHLTVHTHEPSPPSSRQPFSTPAPTPAHNISAQHWPWPDADTNELPEPPSPPLVIPPLLPRPLLTGRPPRRLYLHPDAQRTLLMDPRLRRSSAASSNSKAASKGTGSAPAAHPPVPPESAVAVLPVHMAERLSLRALADVFAHVALPAPIVVPSSAPAHHQDSDDGSGSSDGAPGKYQAENGTSAAKERKGQAAAAAAAAAEAVVVPNGTVKRLLLAAVGDDSTVVYYLVHDGAVKPRQN